jgi:hypothetical protein
MFRGRFASLVQIRKNSNKTKVHFIGVISLKGVVDGAAMVPQL